MTAMVMYLLGMKGNVQYVIKSENQRSTQNILTKWKVKTLNKKDELNEISFILVGGVTDNLR